MKKVLVIGSLNMDIAVETKCLPAVGETVLGKGYTYSPGGKGANQAFTIGRLKGDVTMLGCVGGDDFGRTLIESLAAEGVETKYIRRSEDRATGTAFILTDSKANNSIITIAGANESCDISYIREHEKLIEECDYLLLQMEIPLEAVYYAIDKAKEYQKTVILNPAPAPDNIPADILGKIDVITPNETELRTLTKKNIASKSEIVEGASALIAQGVGNVVVTIGKEGAVWVHPDGYEYFYGNEVPAVDTTGAGDCFNGTLVMGLAGELSFGEAIQNANTVASLSVTKKGAQASIPDVDEVRNFIKI